ncbi:MAG: nucleotidyltransferase family protein [Desulfatiglandales bacterium]
MISVAGLILAAGTSTRMGSPKPLLTMRGSTLLNRILREALHSELERVVLVLGFEASRIRESLEFPLDVPKLTIVENPAYIKGMSSSIIAGLSQVEGSYDHVLIILADMPFITCDLINRFIRRYADSGLPLGAVTQGGKRSHPVIISRRFYQDLHALKGDEGARTLFSKQVNQLCLYEPEGTYNDMDIDTPEDYGSFLESLGKDGGPKG